MIPGRSKPCARSTTAVVERSGRGCSSSVQRLQLSVTVTPDAMHTSEIRITNPDWVDTVVDLQRTYPDDQARIRVAITLARENVMRNSGGPFGAAVFDTTTGKLVGIGTNGVLRLNNSSAHAEVIALMMAQARVRNFTLQGDGTRHELFSSCEPCAMCLGATLWSGVTRLVFAATREDATRLRFDEGPVFPESYRYLADRGVAVTRALLRDEAVSVFDLYAERGGPIYNR